MGTGKRILPHRLYKLATGLESLQVQVDEGFELMFKVEFHDSVAP
jgi:hypothetical protein